MISVIAIRSMDPPDQTKDLMRILFSSVPAFGHLLPLIPLARAARDAGHEVAIMASAGMSPVVTSELSGVSFLPAGPMPDVLFAEVGRRLPDVDPTGAPDPRSAAEFFAGARVDLTIDEALAAVRSWVPDVIVSEATDFVGPLAAAAIGVPSATVAFGPTLPDEFSRPMIERVRPQYAHRGLTLHPPIAVIDPAPRLLQAPGWVPSPLLLPVRPEPHRRDTPSEPMRPFERLSGGPRVLVTLGTVFADDELLRGIIDSIAPGTANIVATVGVLPGAELPSDTDYVHYERFRPMADLLEGVDVVVSAGGAGTVLAALSQGIPLVLIPQGADQFINAERAAHAGVALVVQRPAEVGDALARILSDPSFTHATRVLREDSDQRPTPTAAVAALAGRVEAAKTSS